MPNQQTIVVVVCLVLLGVFFLVFLFTLFGLFRPWFQGFLAGAPVSVMAIIGMRLRRIDVGAVMRSLIMARQSGVPLTHVDLQRAYLRGVDLEKVTLAHIESHKRELGLSFENLVELELSDRLAEKLKR